MNNQRDTNADRPVSANTEPHRQTAHHKSTLPMTNADADSSNAVDLDSSTAGPQQGPTEVDNTKQSPPGACGSDVPPTECAAEQHNAPDHSARPEMKNLLIVIGASAGGFQELVELLSRLPESLQAVIIIATHRNPDYEPRNLLKELLARCAHMKVDDPNDGDDLQCTTVYVGSPGEVLLVDGQEVKIAELARDWSRMHRIDALFESAARAAGHNAVGVILSGMLWDGVQGLQAIREAGGVCIVQDPADATYEDMPRNALAAVDPDFVGTTEEIAQRLIKLARTRHCQ